MPTPLGFTATPAFRRDLVSLPRIDTHTLGLEHFLNPDAYLNGYGITEQESRSLLSQLTSEQVNYEDLLMYTELTGRVESINSLECFNYETGLMERSVKLASVSGTATNPVITLNADSFTTTGSISGPVDRTPLKVGDMIMTNDNLISGLVISKTGTGNSVSFTLQRRDSTSDDLLGELQAHLAGGKRVITYTVASPEGSKSPDEGMFTSSMRLTNQMQTFRSKDALTGDVDALRRTIAWKGKNWEVDVTKLKQQLRHKMQVNRAMWLSPGGNITLAGTGAGSGRVRLTTGLIPGVAQLGASFEYDAAGYSAADIEALDAMVKANYGGSSFTVFEGYKHGGAFFKGIKDLMGDTALAAINFAAFGTKGDARKKALDLGFNGVTTPAGISYFRQESNFFNEPEVTAVAGYPFPGMAVFIPGDNQNITVDQNGVNTKINVPSLRILHTTASSGTVRRYYSFIRKGFETNGDDVDHVETISQQCIQVVDLRKFMLARAA